MLFQFEAMDATGREIKDMVDAPTEEEAQTKIRQMGYFVTKIKRWCSPEHCCKEDGVPKSFKRKRFFRKILARFLRYLADLLDPV